MSIIAIAMITNPIAQAQNRYMVFAFLSLTVIILYHTLRDLSIGFGIFSLVKMHKIFGQKKLKLVILPKNLPRRPGAAGQKENQRNFTSSGSIGYCIAHNPLLLQSLRHWFTFIYRKCEHLAVSFIRKVLYRSRGLPYFWVAFPLL